MTRILVVDDDDAFRQSVSRDLQRHDFDSVTSASVDEALLRLEKERFDVLLTDLRIAERDGIELLQVCREMDLGTRTVLMSAFATARDYETAVELGAVSVLCKPFTSKDLIRSVRQAAECVTGFRGSFHGISLVDILQMFHFGRRSVSILISGPPSAAVHVQDGEIIHAERGEDAGETALARILSASSGAIRTTVLADVPTTIERPFDMLLLDSLRQLDEEAAQSQPNVEDFFGTISWSEPPPPPNGAALGVHDPPKAAPLATSPQKRAAAIWQETAATIGGEATAIDVFAFGRDAEGCVPIAGDRAPQLAAEIEAVARPLSAALEHLAGDGEGFIDAMANAVGIGVVRCDGGDFFIVIVERIDAASSRVWFRSHVAALARTVHSVAADD